MVMRLRRDCPSYFRIRRRSVAGHGKEVSRTANIAAAPALAERSVSAASGFRQMDLNIEHRSVYRTARI